MEILGVFADLDEAARAVDDLLAIGIPETKITSLSSVPYPDGVLVREKHQPRFYLGSLAFGAVGALIGFSLAAGTAWLYPLQTGDKPIISIFPVGIITYELMMLFAIIGTLVGMFWCMGLPDFRPKPYAAEIAIGAIGILVQTEHPGEVEVARRAMQSSGAQRLCTEEDEE